MKALRSLCHILGVLDVGGPDYGPVNADSMVPSTKGVPWLVTGEQGEELQRSHLATPFPMYSQWTQRVTGKLRIEDGRVVLEGIDWGKSENLPRRQGGFPR
jgi:hypothetical protein